MSEIGQRWETFQAPHHKYQTKPKSQISMPKTILPRWEAGIHQQAHRDPRLFEFTAFGFGACWRFWCLLEIWCPRFDILPRHRPRPACRQNPSISPRLRDTWLTCKFVMLPYRPSLHERRNYRRPQSFVKWGKRGQWQAWRGGGRIGCRLFASQMRGRMAMAVGNISFRVWYYFGGLGMNRVFMFGVAMFFAIVGIALLGGQKQAAAGHGCCGVVATCSAVDTGCVPTCRGRCFGRVRQHHARRCGGCFGRLLSRRRCCGQPTDCCGTPVDCCGAPVADCCGTVVHEHEAAPTEADVQEAPPTEDPGGAAPAEEGAK